MKAYVYQAALLCEACALKERERILAADRAAGGGGIESIWETGVGSDGYPAGPYSNGGGEADCPQHCDHCGLFLENTLTPDGDAYVREKAEPYTYPDERDGDVAPWSLVAERAAADGQEVLAEWIEFYFAPGM